MSLDGSTNDTDAPLHNGPTARLNPAVLTRSALDFRSGREPIEHSNRKGEVGLPAQASHAERSLRTPPKGRENSIFRASDNCFKALKANSLISHICLCYGENFDVSELASISCDSRVVRVSRHLLARSRLCRTQSSVTDAWIGTPPVAVI
jgi:hypothetical protein